QLGIPGFHLVLLNMNGGVHVIPDDFFIQKDSVLVVITFPSHKADQSVLAQADLAVLDGGTVGNDRTLFHALTHRHHRHLVDTGALVGTHELDDLVIVDIAIVGSDANQVGADGLHHAATLCQHAHTGVHTG